MRRDLHAGGGTVGSQCFHFHVEHPELRRIFPAGLLLLPQRHQMIAGG
jgi:hypothetical protein